MLAWVGFKGALLTMAGGLALIWISSLILLKKDLGKAKAKPKFRDILSKSRAINILSAARMFLFGARDVWFVVALPVYLSSVFGWDFWKVGGFLAAWVIGYGIVQSFAPNITGKKRGHVPDGRAAFLWALALAGLPAAIALGLDTGLSQQMVLLGGLMVFRCFVRREFVAAQLPDRVLRQGRRRVAGCGVLLHVERHGALDRHRALWLDLPGVWIGRMPLDIKRIRVAGRLDFHRFTQACRGDMKLPGRTA
nr:hypothetical protein GCM10020185_63460 [Pseudomonas brassicacearum subsp. brassicacearum]